MLKELFLLDEGPVQKVSASNGCGWWITTALHSQYRDQPILFRGQIWSTVAVSEYNCDHSDIKTNNGPPPFLTRLAPDIPPGHPVVTASARSGPGRLLTFDDPAGGTAPAPAPHRNTQDSKQMFSWVRTFLVSGHIRQWMSWESYFIRIEFDWQWTLVPKILKNISLIGGVIQ